MGHAKGVKAAVKGFLFPFVNFAVAAQNKFCLRSNDWQFDGTCLRKMTSRMR